VANRPQYEKVLGYLRGARDEGWTMATGGEANDELGGLSVRPTVVLAEPDATIAREEVFGPVLAAYTIREEEEAVRLANDTPFGLAGAVWTKDVHRAHRVASAIRAGTVWINAYRVVAPNMPFGGFGLSGIGRENGSAAVDEYLESSPCSSSSPVGRGTRSSWADPPAPSTAVHGHAAEGGRRRCLTGSLVDHRPTPFAHVRP